MFEFDDKSLNKRQYIEGVSVFEGGDDALEAYLIEEGEVKIFRKENGVRHDIAVLGPGEIFGEMALVKNMQHTSSAIATKQSLLVVITKDMIQEKLKESDPLIKGLIHMFIRRIYQANDEKQGK